MNLKHLFILLLFFFGVSCQQRYAHRAKVKMPASPKVVKQTTPKHSVDSFYLNKEISLTKELKDSSVQLAHHQSITTSSKQLPKIAHTNKSHKKRAPNASRKNEKRAKQKTKAPPLELIILACLIAIPLIILLITNRKPHVARAPSPAKEPPNPKINIPLDSDQTERKVLKLLGVLLGLVVGLYLIGFLVGPVLIGMLLFGTSSSNGIILLLVGSILMIAILAFALYAIIVILV